MGRIMEENFYAWLNSATILYCVMCAEYQLIKGDNRSELILRLNAGGALIQVVCLVVAFGFFSDKRVTIVEMSVIKFIIVVGINVGVLYSPNIKTQIVGWACVACGILMYGSTAPDLYEAWKAENIGIFHLLRTTVGLANTIIWLKYGIRQDEKFIKIPNAVNVALCSLQLIVCLIIIFKRKCNTPSNPSEVEINSIVTAV